MIFHAPAIGQTSAGTTITNAATLRYDIAGSTITSTSNTDVLIVAERIDVTARRAAPTMITPLVGNFALPLTIRNAGNGNEAFDLAAASDSGVVTISGFAIDSDGDGRFDPARDVLLDGGRTASLAPGSDLALLILADGGAQAASATGSIVFVARAVTGVGTPGTIKVGQGDGGGDAVIGATGAEARLTIPFSAGATAALVKSQTVRAPDGSARPVRGAVVTYVMRARFDAPVTEARIVDPVPDGTVFVPGSLRLDDAQITDASDSDAGSFDGRAIAVALGDVAAGDERTLQFQVTIQ